MRPRTASAPACRSTSKANGHVHVENRRKPVFHLPNFHCFLPASGLDYRLSNPSYPLSTMFNPLFRPGIRACLAILALGSAFPAVAADMVRFRFDDSVSAADRAIWQPKLEEAA